MSQSRFTDDDEEVAPVTEPTALADQMKDLKKNVTNWRRSFNCTASCLTASDHQQIRRISELEQRVNGLVTVFNQQTTAFKEQIDKLTTVVTLLQSERAAEKAAEAAGYADISRRLTDLRSTNVERLAAPAGV